LYDVVVVYVIMKFKKSGNRPAVMKLLERDTPDEVESLVAMLKKLEKCTTYICIADRKEST
jgi:hypothetical protein